MLLQTLLLIVKDLKGKKKTIIIIIIKKSLFTQDFWSLVLILVKIIFKNGGTRRRKISY